MAHAKQASTALAIQQQKKVQVFSKGSKKSRKEKSSPRHESTHPTTPCQCHRILHHLRQFVPKSAVGEAASEECAVNCRSCGRGGELSVGRQLFPFMVVQRPLPSRFGFSPIGSNCILSIMLPPQTRFKLERFGHIEYDVTILIRTLFAHAFTDVVSRFHEVFVAILDILQDNIWSTRLYDGTSLFREMLPCPDSFGSTLRARGCIRRRLFGASGPDEAEEALSEDKDWKRKRRHDEPLTSTITGQKRGKSEKPKSLKKVHEIEIARIKIGLQWTARSAQGSQARRTIKRLGPIDDEQTDDTEGMEQTTKRMTKANRRKGWKERCLPSLSQPLFVSTKDNPSKLNEQNVEEAKLQGISVCAKKRGLRGEECAVNFRNCGMARELSVG
ncbi:hypothetical protein C8J56DRAFT_897835 [Mycena floridula]|nr:hypothetical protein C8J56DRAFT_897835 [Mycena floridula]